jgi:basic membrane lipoprotein Med (substrate-binding protein (PBP1-ABC) superfamily)
MKKQGMAILAAFFVTACIGAAIFAIGGAALVNKNPAAVSASSTRVTAITVSGPLQQGQVAQLQDLVAQYQDREQQYQQREQQLKDQLAQSNAQLQQDQQLLQQVQILLAALQQRGLISVTSDGRILINQ